MKDAKNIGMLTAVVFAIGMVGFNLSDGTFALQSDAPTSTIDGASIMGHMEIIHTDSEGNILSYQQTDNAIVNEGRNCVTVLLFGPLANTSCDDQSPGIYTVVGIGNSTTLPSTTGVTTQSDLTGEITDNNMARVNGVVTVSQVSASTADQDPAVARISSVFTWLGGTTNTVNQAGLFNTTDTGASGTFALKDFPSPVAMNTNDQLTVNWDITIDGSDTFN